MKVVCNLGKLLWKMCVVWSKSKLLMWSDVRRCVKIVVEDEGSVNIK